MRVCAKASAGAGLVLIVCGAAIAFALPATASAATVFCKTDAETCSKENTYAIGSEFSFSLNGTTAILETIAAKHKCKQGAIGMKSEKAAESGALLGKVTSLTFGECTVEVGFGECKSREVRNLPWSAEWIRAGAERRLIMGDSGKGRPAIRLLCAGFSCTYGSATVELQMPVLSGLTNVQVNRELPLFEGSPLCATVLSWTADYNAPSPEAVFLTQG
jgi:hypothetical protein